MRKWRIEDSEELYNITGWGTSYFGINDKGHVVVTPRKDGVEVDLKELVDELQLRDVAAPMLVRFPDILDNRIEKSRTALSRHLMSMGIRPEFYHLSYQGKSDASCSGRNHQSWKEIQFGTGSRFQT